ncbi:MAG: hypothetical protein D6732_10080 [Methanobacteriota archaeon]|nr:MAG: hypothetical protein D6732_10080 [Euryarchaeota archaeon]
MQADELFGGRNMHWAVRTLALYVASLGSFALPFWIYSLLDFPPVPDFSHNLFIFKTAAVSTALSYLAPYAWLYVEERVGRSCDDTVLFEFFSVHWTLLFMFLSGVFFPENLPYEIPKVVGIVYALIGLSHSAINTYHVYRLQDSEAN